MNAETALTRNIRLALNRTGRVRIVRNNTGVDTAAGIRYGLGVGGADLVGILQNSGRVVALECKMPKARGATPEQLAWLSAVRRFGGFACVVRSIEDALAAIDRAERGACE